MDESGKVSFFGKSFDKVGDNSSNLCLYTAGDIKVKTPNRFITIFKNGKLNVDDSTEIYSVSSEEDMDKTGIYLVTDDEGNSSVYLYLDGQKILLASTADAFISYSTIQSLTADEFFRALNNIGFYFETLEDGQNSNLKNGLAYILDEQQLYKVVNGVWSLYIEPEEEEENEPLTQLQIGGIFIDGENFLINSDQELTIQVGGVDYVILRENGIYVLKDIVLQKDVYTRYAQKGKSGLYIYTQNGEVYLETDYLIVHNGLPASASDLYKAYLGSAVTNVILTATIADVDDDDEEAEADSIDLTLKYQNEFAVNDYVLVHTLSGNRLETGSDSNDDDIPYIYAYLEKVPKSVCVIQVKYSYSLEDEGDKLTDTVTLTIDPSEYDPETEEGGNYASYELPESYYDIYVTNTTVLSGDSDIYLGNEGESIIPNPIIGVVTEIDSNSITISLSEVSDSIAENLVNTVIYKLSDTPVLYCESFNISLREYDKDEYVIRSKIGSLSDIDSPDPTSQYYYGFHVGGYGMYSDNLNGAFGSWPRYDADTEMPDEYYDDEMYDKVVPDIKWVKALLDNAKTNPPVLDQSLIEFDLDGGSAVVNVTADDEWSAFISGGWLIDEIDGDRISISIDANETTIERTGVLTVVMNGLVACCQLTQVEGEQGAIRIWAEPTPGFSPYVNILATRSLKDDLTVCVEGTKAEDESHFGPLCIEFKAGESTTGIQTDFGVSAASVVSVNDQEDPPLVTENDQYTW